MIWTKNKQTFAATQCLKTGKPCPALARMVDRLATAMSSARSVTAADFEIEGSAQLFHCGQDCTALYRANHARIRMYAGVAETTDLDVMGRYADAMMDPEGRGFPAPGIAPPCAMVEARLPRAEQENTAQAAV
ncbi:hypothetical protein Q5Y75_14120 [Ruegeria sp. 2205SS24-7]|uniref:hypothetical protein n=1 Tax=Ruegeria discodermiae TaxID=3064389 RepID=UPI002741E30B|nr:hypothetical protein [Ruegeria sp. 2205SS24-7]MDP5218364.1 hypothetical protein [Ruegeria sp. 2205SS24-7]